MTTLLPRLALDLARPAPPDLRGLFAGPVEDVALEIGFGGGEHLLAEAGRQPHRGFIGCEAFVNGMAKALAGIAEAGLANVRLHFGTAAPLLAWLPDKGLAQIDLLYPDPWPKRRHWKRRFIQDATVAVLARLLRPGGLLRVATDIDSYVAWTLQHLLRSPAFEWTAERAEDWRRPWAGFAGTRYEAKARREGRTPVYLTFRRL